MKLPEGERLYIQEVCTRDGFQSEPVFVPTDEKVRLIDELSQTGVSAIEVSSFSSPAAIPALSDAVDVFSRIKRIDSVEYGALVPNLRGCERALACDVDVINLVISASETHNRANLRMSCEQSLAQLAAIVAICPSQVGINVSIATAFGCPFEGDIDPARVFEIIERLEALKVARVALSDTTGMANPAQVFGLFSAVVNRWPQTEFIAHFHNTRGMGLANVLAALEAGIIRFDGSLGGLGGCPFAPGATGNVCTEDMVHMLATMGYEMGIDLERLLAAARRLPAIVGHDVSGQLIKAGPSSRTYTLQDLKASV